MERTEIESKVLEIIVTQGAQAMDSSPRLDQELDSLGLDSMDRVGVVMAVEDAFDLDITDEDAEKFNSGKDIVDYLATKVE